MNLHKATLFLILGSFYTISHKIVYSLFPSLGFTEPWGLLTTVLWITATFALILFAFQFLKELEPRKKWMRVSLIGIIVFTRMVIVSKLPLKPLDVNGGLGHRWLLEISSWLNSLSILVFTLSFRRSISKDTILWRPTFLLIAASGLTLALSFVSLGYSVSYFSTREAIEPLLFLQPLSILSFIFTYTSTLWFLIRFRRIDNYKELLQ
jgi:hypothetical protein